MEWRKQSAVPTAFALRIPARRLSKQNGCLLGHPFFLDGVVSRKGAFTAVRCSTWALRALAECNPRGHGRSPALLGVRGGIVGGEVVARTSVYPVAEAIDVSGRFAPTKDAAARCGSHSGAG